MSLLTKKASEKSGAFLVYIDYFPYLCKMERINITAVKRDNKLKILNKPTLDYWIDSLKEEETVEISLIRDEDLRTIRQIRLLYKCFRTISEHTGHSVEDVKIMMKLKFGMCHSHTIEGIEITVCDSISDLTKKEINKFIEDIDIWSSQTLNCPLITHEDINFLKNIS